MPPRTYSPNPLSSLGMSEPERTIEYSRLLSESQRVRLAIRCVSEQVPGASGETERPDV